jgi:hypothetical protein
VNFVGFFGFAEEGAGIAELGFECVPDFLPYLIAAAPNAGTDCRFQVSGPTAEVPLHFTNTFFYDPLHRASPSGMKHTNGVPLRIREDYWKAVSGQNGEENVGSAGDEAVAGQRFFWNSGDAVDEIGMNLSQGDDWPGRAFLCSCPSS